jgi:hypothetical protein
VWKPDAFERTKDSQGIEPEIGMRRIATIKDNGKLQKAGLYLSKCKNKWKRSVIKYEEE